MLSLLVAACLLLLGSCESRQHGAEPAENDEIGTAAVGFALPSPSKLAWTPAPLRQGSYLPADLAIEGEDYSTVLPSSHMSGSPDGGLFSPAPAPGGGLAARAYATYVFRIADYDLNSEVQLEWDDALPDNGRLWLALANWQEDRWDWYAASPSVESIRPASLEPYFTFGGDLLAVLLLEPGPALKLDRIRIGTQLPSAEFVFTGPRVGWGTLDTTVDASASSDPEGTALTYSWDLDGDGSFDESGPEPVLSHVFDQPGSFDLTLKVTDADGGYASATQTYSVASSWTHTLGGELFDRFYDVQAAADGTIWACGETVTAQQSTFSGSSLLLARYSASGELMKEFYWASDTGQFSTHRAEHIEIDALGNIYLFGDAFSQQFSAEILQKYDSEGELLWTRESTSTNHNYYGFNLLNGEVVLYGNTFVPPGTTTVPHYLRLDSEGAYIASGRADVTGGIRAATYKQSLIFEEPSALVFAGYVEAGGDAALFILPVDGSRESASQWSIPATAEVAQSVALYGGTAFDRDIYVGVTQYDSSSDTSNAMLVLVGTSATVAVRFCGSNSAVALIRSGSSLKMLLENSAGTPVYLDWDQTPVPGAGYSYDAGFSASLAMGADYEGPALVTIGYQPVAAGNFGAAYTPNTEAKSGTWTNLTIDFQESSDNFLLGPSDNFTSVVTRTQDSGAGGGGDAWINLHNPEDF